MLTHPQCRTELVVVIISSNKSILLKKPYKHKKFWIYLMFIVEQETTFARDFLYLRQESDISV